MQAMPSSKLVQNLLLIAMYEAIWLITGCQGENPENTIAYITNGDYACADPGEARLANVKSRLPAGFVKGYSDSQMVVALNRIALIPDRDLNYLIGNFKSGKLKGISPGFGLFGVAGLTTLGYGTSPAGRTGMVANSITTAASMSGFALQHEIGHAVEILAIDAAAETTSYSNFDSALAQLHKEIQSRPDARGYAKSSASESWAEAYAQYYCSPESNAYIQNNLPYTNGLLRAVLPPPIWEGGGGVTPTLPVSSDNIVAPAGSTINNPAPSGSQNPFQSFIDKIGSLFKTPNSTTNSGTNNIANNAITPNGSSNAIPNGPSNITMALQDIAGTPRATGVTIASSLVITKVVLCIGTKQTCVAKEVLPTTMGNNFLFDNYAPGRERNFFRMKSINQDQEKVFASEWHLAGYDDNGNLVATRDLKMQAAAGATSLIGSSNNK